MRPRTRRPISCGLLALAVAVAVPWDVHAPRAQDEGPARQVTLFGIIATSGSRTVDKRLKTIEPRLRKLMPDHGFKLLDVQSKRLMPGMSVASDFRNGFSAEAQLINALDPESGKTRVLDALHDEAWVREAGGGGFGAFDGSAGFVDATRVWFLSERDGWMHLYTVDANASQPAAKQLTQGKWEIESVALSHDRKTFYITSSEQHPGERHLYAMSIGGGARTKITSMVGSNQSEVSPDDSTIGLVYSYSNKPPEVYVMPNKPGAAVPS